jgi:hypothetical protein
MADNLTRVWAKAGETTTRTSPANIPQRATIKLTGNWFIGLLYMIAAGFETHMAGG